MSAPNIILAAGGTGGHMFPASALAAELKAQGFEVHLLTDNRGMAFVRQLTKMEVHRIPAATVYGGGVFALPLRILTLLVTMLMVPDLTNNISLLGALFFVYNVFTALQDVSTDALAVDVLQSHEFERVNSYMFTAKSLGGVIGGAGLGTIIGIVGIRGAFLIQIPILIVIMMVPLFMRERPGEKRFPWDEGDAVEIA